ncbi:lytic transglycosylase domain-containing protein [Streptomyces celluloflavus]|uniref:lytic transglycosylase domain-containing protein n=1 Tax=Streptomyces celluloflavus TaxID=58344 RepID=UPI0036980877
MAARYGRRLRKGAASTAVAAAALAALTASQAPGVAQSVVAKEQPAPPPRPADTSVDGGSAYYTDLPPLKSPVPPGGSDGPGTTAGTGIGTGATEAGIPATVLAAYKKAEAAIAESDPGCRLPWQLLAAIGKVESGHANGGAVDVEGTTLKPILGPQLNGNGFASIPDTDGGRYDGDPRYDHAVGPMQFIPSTWSKGGPNGNGWGADGNGDGKKDPNNVFDATLAAGHYLCNGGRDLSVQRDLERAILSYNYSQDYLHTVLSWYAYYRKGTHEVPDGTGALPVHHSGSGTGSGGPAGGARPGTHPGGSGTGGAKPGKTTPDKPKEPAGPGGSHGSDGSSGSGDKPTPTPTPTPPAKPAPLTALERVGDKSLTATAGTEFAAPPRVRAEDAAGKPVAGASVRFTLVGSTDARFPGDATAVTVTTGKDGLATAPTLRAGDKAGAFTVRATAVGRTVPAVDFDGTVKAKPAPKADALARTSDKELTATAGAAFADDAVEVKATYQGKAAAGVRVTATMVTDDPKNPVENGAGPYFKNPGATGADKDKPVRTLTTLTTDANGLLKLPKIYTDAHTGTFQLRLTTADGAVLTVKLNVQAPAGS